MAAPMDAVFDRWLAERLTQLNGDVDLDVFPMYISGVLESDTSEEEKSESLSEFLGEIVEDGIEELCKEILQKWNEGHAGETQTSNEVESFDAKLHSIIEKQQTQVVKSKTITSEEKARKALILAQYGAVSDGDEDEDELEGAVGGGDDPLGRNFNSLGIREMESEMRDKMKAEHDAKKRKDKEDREKQKQKVIDRKDSEKKRTQKGERRR